MMMNVQSDKIVHTKICRYKNKISVLAITFSWKKIQKKRVCYASHCMRVEKREHSFTINQCKKDSLFSTYLRQLYLNARFSGLPALN